MLLISGKMISLRFKAEIMPEVNCWWNSSRFW